MSDSDLRDHLAVERTHLSNERTFLAYVRTALSLIIGGAVILQFLPDKPTLVFVAWAAIAAGVVGGFVGIYRFLKVRSQIPKVRA